MSQTPGNSCTFTIAPSIAPFHLILFALIISNFFTSGEIWVALTSEHYFRQWHFQLLISLDIGGSDVEVCQSGGNPPSTVSLLSAVMVSLMLH